MQNILVIGATGDVGQGITRQLLQRGHRVLASARRSEPLALLASAQADAQAQGRLLTLPGSVAHEDSAATLLADVRSALGRIDATATLDAVIVAVCAPSDLQLLKDMPSARWQAMLEGNLTPHFVAIKTFMGALRPQGLLLSIGGGTADIAWAGMGHVGAMQAAQRQMIRVMAKEYRDLPVKLRELMLYSMIVTEHNRAQAQPGWLTDDDVGNHVADIVEMPDAYPETILALHQKDKV